ncbi:hypothetical protein JW921_05595 [Candidatus Fermentibacterales bacterium]|nr:hypothetical protein [Candidatus Fermentibacterales bacterium]
MREDSGARRYWGSVMEEAFRFRQRALEHPVEECGEPLVDLPTACEEAGVHVSFSDAPFPGGHFRIFALRQGLVEAFLSIARDLNSMDLVLRLEDCFRTPAMQKALASAPGIPERVAELVRWETGLDAPPDDVLEKRLSVLVATHVRTAGHMSGSALDVTVLRMPDGKEVDRGGSYLDLSVITPMDSPFIGPDAVRNRRVISGVLASRGFPAYPWEFWHYSSGDVVAELASGSGQPARYGPIARDS